MTCAAYCGHYDAVQALVEAGGADVNLARQDGTTPLNLAAYADAKTALFLLDNGAKPDTNTNKSSPFPVPLVMSAARGDVQLCARLIQAGSDPDELHPTEGFAPLHAAVSSEASRTEVIKLLLAAGADVNLLRSANPIWSPLMYAATRGSVEHLQLLLGGLTLGAIQCIYHTMFVYMLQYSVDVPCTCYRISFLRHSGSAGVVVLNVLFY